MPHPFLSIIGIGEDGITSLSSTARSRLQNAHLVFGGKRHLALASPLIKGKTESWLNPIQRSIERILECKTLPIAVLASGDPFWYGVGSLLANALRPEEWESFPAISCRTLACNQLGWAEQETQTVSLCGRDLQTLRPYLTPYRKLLILSADANTPLQVQEKLEQWQISYKDFYILEALGGKEERIRHFSASATLPTTINPLNMIALKLDNFQPLPFTHGRPDSLFKNDGQLTKQIVRSSTLSALQPYPNALLWDIGTGSGSIAIEWMLTHPSCRAIAIEPRQERAERAKRNAETMGVPSLQIIKGKAPAALAGLPRPNAVFIGGGMTCPNLLQYVWDQLLPYGRLVINSVTTEGDLLLFQAFQQWGGEINRIEVQHLETLGSYHGFKPYRPITQYSVTHP